MHLFPDTIHRISSADGSVLLDVRRGTMFRVNSVAARIIELLESHCSPRAIADALSAEFGVATDVVLADVDDFLRSLADHGLLDPQWSSTYAHARK